MKKLSFIAMTFLAAWTFQSCGESNTQDSIASANEVNEQKQEPATDQPSALAPTVTEDDSKFAVNTAGAGIMEVQFAELAQQKAQSEKVKEYAATLAKDHTKANEELKNLAATKNITLPSTLPEDHQKHFAQLSEKSGKEFDKEYISIMIDDHKKNIDAFEKASASSNDADLKAWAGTIVPTLKGHLEQAESIKKTLK